MKWFQWLTRCLVWLLLQQNIKAIDTTSESSGIPLIILAPSAAGGGIFLIIIVILCCWNYRRLKRKRNERIFQKYYCPTLPSKSDLKEEDDNDCNMWASSQLKLQKSENKEEQSNDSKSPQGISNEAFVTSESLSEINLIKEKPEKVPSDPSVEIEKDTQSPMSNKDQDVHIKDINSSSEVDHCDKVYTEHTSEKATTVMEEKISLVDDPICDDHKKSLLHSQNLDLLKNECVNKETEVDGEISEIESTLNDQNMADKAEIFLVLFPFLASPNTDEITLDVDTRVSVISSDPSGWSWVENEDGDAGFFPTQYLAKSEDTHGSNHFGYSIPDQKRLHFAVLQSFSGSSPDQLSLAKHDIVRVIENSATGWSWVNEPSVGTGWFPTDYLEPLVFPKKKDKTQYMPPVKNPDYLPVIGEENHYVYASHEEIQKVKNEGQYQEYEAKAYLASHAYTGNNEDELTFKENETILVLQETDSGWWRGSTYLEEGWFPSTFVQDPVTCRDIITADDPSLLEDYYDNADCNKYSMQACPYKVTELLTKKDHLNKQREIIHQVPPPISQQAVKQHNKKSKGKEAVLKPRRPPPPPPATFPKHSTQPIPPVLPLDPHPAVPSIVQLPSVLSTAPITSVPSTSPLAPVLSTASSDPPLIQALNDVEYLQTVPKQEETTNNQENEYIEPGRVEGVVIVPPRQQSGTTMSKLIKVTNRRSIIDPNPSQRPPNRPIPVPPPRKVRNAPKSTDNHPRLRPTKIPRNAGNKKHTNALNINNVPKQVPERPPPPMPEKLDEYRRRRLCSESSGEGSSIGLNEEHLRRKQSGSDNEQSTDVHDSNKKNVNPNIVSKVAEDVYQINGGVNVDKHFDVTDKTNGPRNDEKINRNEEKAEEKVSPSSPPKPKQRNIKLCNNDQNDQSVFDKKNENMVSADTGKRSPTPKPQKRSREQLQIIPLLETEEQVAKSREERIDQEDVTVNEKSQFTEKSPSTDERKVDASKANVRSQSLDEPSNNQLSEEKPRPKIKPRSKSMENIFSSTSKSNSNNSEKDATSESQPRVRLQSLPEDNSLSNKPNDNGVTETHDSRYIQYDNNQTIAEAKSAEATHPPPRSVPRPKPKARTKQHDR